MKKSFAKYNSISGFAHILFLIGILTIGTIVFILHFRFQDNLRTVFSEISTEDWNIFINEEYDYAFNYPKDWQVDSNSAVYSLNSIKTYLDNDADVTFIVHEFNTEVELTEEWYFDWMMQFPIELPPRDSFTFEKSKFLSYDALKINKSQLFFSKDGNLFQISWYVNRDQPDKRYKQQIIDQILSTFRFAEVPFMTIERGGFGVGLKDKSEFVIDNNKDWENLWSEIYSGVSVPVELPKIDFDNETIIAVFMGEKEGGGYSTEIVNIEEKGGHFQVDVMEQEPSDRQDKQGAIYLTIAALTYPYHIVKTAKIDKEVVFNFIN